MSTECGGNGSLSLLRWVRPQECTSRFDGFAIGRAAQKIRKSASLLSAGRSQAELHQALGTRHSSCGPVSTQHPVAHPLLGRWWGGIIFLSLGCPQLGSWCYPSWERMLPGKSFQQFGTRTVTFALPASERALAPPARGPGVTYRICTARVYAWVCLMES